VLYDLAGIHDIGCVIMGIDELRLYVEMLGGFSITNGENRITEQGKRSSKMWKLLQYLIANRHKSVSQEEIIDTFWADETSENPGSAIRTMIHRARAALVAGGLTNADDIILARGGGYTWNDAAVCHVDAEEFEEFCKKANSVITAGERLELLLQAAELYKGDFLPGSSDEIWVLPLSRWYRTLYINCIHDALELLTSVNDNAKAEELCAKALRLDPFDEQILEYHLRSLLAQDKNSEAREIYKKMEDMFYDVLGVSFSDNLHELYTQIERPEIDEDLSLEDLMNKWLDNSDFSGAYYCDLIVFRTVYQIEARSGLRSGRPAYIVRFETKQVPAQKGVTVMDQLAVSIPVALRKGDLYTRAGPRQYMMMLRNLTYENCKMLVERILGTLNTKQLSNISGTSIKPIIPFE